MPAEPYRVHMLSSIPPPYGGVNIWTQWFMQHAASFGLQVSLEKIGPRDTQNTFAVAARLRRLGAGLVYPACHIQWGTARGAQVLHICVSGGVSFWRGLLLARLWAQQRKRCVVHLHSRASTCAPRALKWAATLCEGPYVRLVTPNHEDGALHKFMRVIDHFIPDDHGKGAVWGGLRPESTLRLVYMGWMIRGKGLFDMLAALSCAPNVSLDAFGPNVCPQDLQAWQAEIGQRGLQARVRYRGVVEHVQVAAVMGQYDALVAPSHGESFGFATAEAMHLGVPVLATPVGYLWDAPQDCFVRLERQSMGATLLALGRSKQSLVDRGARGRAYVRDTLSLPRSMAAWKQTYQGISR